MVVMQLRLAMRVSLQLVGHYGGNCGLGGAKRVGTAEWGPEYAWGVGGWDGHL